MGPPVGSKLRVGVVKYASCDGCQLSILDLENELLPLSGLVEFVEFPEATSVRSTGPFDLLIVEGSISTPDQAREIRELRANAALLATIGACASSGGIQALRNWLDHDEVRATVYANPGYIESLATAVPVREHVPVDLEIRGCPVDPGQLREVLGALLSGRRPQIREEAVCMECKRRSLACVLVVGGEACLGPVTQAGCGAICPSMGRGCYGCFGPKESANVKSLARRLTADGRSPTEVGRVFAGINSWSEPFRGVVADLGGLDATDPRQQPHGSTTDAR
jgi:coenzyme F420-reducing hydrogenase gamma subunit